MQPNVQSSSPSSGEERRYKGVRRRKWGRWVSEIRLPKSRERIWLGSYDAPEKAARAFDAAFVCLRGLGAAGGGGLNFPESPPDVARTSDPEEVYAAAVSHANRAAATAPPWDDATGEPSSELMQTHDDGAPVEAAAVAAVPPALGLASLEVSVESLDWSQLLADLPPLFSPTHEVGSQAYLPVPSLTAADDDIAMEESESGSRPGLWSFDSTSQ